MVAESMASGYTQVLSSSCAAKKSKVGVKEEVEGEMRADATPEDNDGVEARAAGSACALSVLAAAHSSSRTGDALKMVVRVTNPTPSSINVTFDLQGFGEGVPAYTAHHDAHGAAPFTHVSVSQLHSDVLSADNSPSDPTRHSPKTSAMPFAEGAVVVVPANSFTIYTFS
jgi:hypothetical protein